MHGKAPAHIIAEREDVLRRDAEVRRQLHLRGHRGDVLPDHISSISFDRGREPMLHRFRVHDRFRGREGLGDDDDQRRRRVDAVDLASEVYRINISYELQSSAFGSFLAFCVRP